MNNTSGTTTISITTGTILKTLGIILALVLLFILRDLVLILLTSVVIAAAVVPTAKIISGNKIPHAVSVVLVYLLFFILFFGVIYFLVPPIFQDLTALTGNWPEKIGSIGGISTSADPLSTVTGGFAKSITVEQMLVQMQNLIEDASGSFLNVTSFIFGGVVSFVLILVISFYLAVQENGVENFLRVAVPTKNEEYAIGLWRRSQNKIGKWLQGHVLLSLIVGLLVFLGLTILRVPHAMSLAVLAALFEIIPFFGPIISAVPGVLVGLNDGLTLGLMVLGLYLIVQQFENHLIYPLVVKKIVGVNPLIVIIAIIIGAQLAGFLGIILAVPLTTVIMELVSDIEKKKLKEKTAEK